ncbi:MAG: type IV pilus assembly protein PilM [Candidatus Kerfeldbacteria bacterium]|nr:type IV pilus assembly protein PilM [Candidatus Kerfeldbacteria bacterium]
MALLGRKASYLGIDLGASSLKIVELKNEGGRPKLVTYGFAEQRTDVVRSDSAEDQQRIVVALKAILRKARVSTNRLVAALPSFAVFTSIISLPEMSKKDLFAAVRWEAKKFVPMPLEEMVLDWRLLQKQESAEGNQLLAGSRKPNADSRPAGPKSMKVLLTAAPKNLVRRYIEIFRTCDLQIVSLETEAFALQRSLIGAEPNPTMIVDIGAVATDVSVVVDGIPLINRSIDAGGDTITKAIANSLSVDPERAEQFKRDFGIASTSGGVNELPQAIDFVISSIVNEIRYVLNLYRAQEERPIEKLILAGGSAFLPQLPEYLSKTLNMKVIIGDAWARVIYPKELKVALDEIGPRFAVAIGLAMREIVG